MKSAALNNIISKPGGFNCFTLLCNWGLWECGCVFKCTSVCFCHAISRWQIWNWRVSPNRALLKPLTLLQIGSGEKKSNNICDWFNYPGFLMCFIADSWFFPLFTISHKLSPSFNKSIFLFIWSVISLKSSKISYHVFDRHFVHLKIIINWLITCWADSSLSRTVKMSLDYYLDQIPDICGAVLWPENSYLGGIPTLVESQ